MVRLSTPVARTPKWPPIENGEIAQGDVAAELERDGLVAAAPPLAGQRFARDAPAAGDGDVFEVLAPDQAVVKVAVAEILELVPLVGLGGSYAEASALASMTAPRSRCRVTLLRSRMRAGYPDSGREVDRAATGRRRGLDGFIDGVAILRFAVALGAVGGDVEGGGVQGCSG